MFLGDKSNPLFGCPFLLYCAVLCSWTSILLLYSVLVFTCQHLPADRLLSSSLTLAFFTHTGWLDPRLSCLEKWIPAANLHPDCHRSQEGGEPWLKSDPELCHLLSSEAYLMQVTVKQQQHWKQCLCLPAAFLNSFCLCCATAVATVSLCASGNEWK